MIQESVANQIGTKLVKEYDDFLASILTRRLGDWTLEGLKGRLTRLDAGDQEHIYLDAELIMVAFPIRTAWRGSAISASRHLMEVRR